MIKIDPIAVKDKRDVIKALTILEKIGINVFSETEKEIYLNNESRTVNNNFLIQEEDGGFRVQSHYIGNGISLESLETQVDKINITYPNVVKQMKELTELKNKIQAEIQQISITERNLQIEIKEIKNEN